MALNDITALEEIHLNDSEINLLNGTESVSTTDVVISQIPDQSDHAAIADIEDVTDLLAVDSIFNGESNHPLLVNLTEELRTHESNMPGSPVNIFNASNNPTGNVIQPITVPDRSLPGVLTYILDGLPSTSAEPDPWSLSGSITAKSVSTKRKCDPSEVVDCSPPKLSHLSNYDLGPIEIPDFIDISHEEPATPCQILDIFPDIDKMFLKNECRKGLDINSLTELILDMNNNYPREPQLLSMPHTRDQFQPTKRNAKKRAVSATAVRPTREIDDLDIVIDEVATNSARAFGGILNSSKTSRNNAKKCRVSATTVRPTTELDNFEIVIDEVATNSAAADQHVVPSAETGPTIKPIDDAESSLALKADNLEFLTSIFPDADDEFLEEKSKLGQHDIRSFVSVALEQNDYPRKKPLKKEEEPDDVGLYSTSFSVSNFLQVFPDPITYFMDESRVCQSSVHATEFLKRRYRKHLWKTLSETYKNFKYNLARTCHHLDTTTEVLELRGAPRTKQEIKMPNTINTPFLKEACFIEHKEGIKDYIDRRADAKALAYQQMREF